MPEKLAVMHELTVPVVLAHNVSVEEAESDGRGDAESDVDIVPLPLVEIEALDETEPLIDTDPEWVRTDGDTSADLVACGDALLELQTDAHALTEIVSVGIGDTLTASEWEPIAL